METQGEQCEYKEKNVNTRRTIGTHGEKREDKGNGNTRRTGIQGEKEKEKGKEDNGNIRRTMGTVNFQVTSPHA